MCGLSTCSVISVLSMFNDWEKGRGQMSRPRPEWDVELYMGGTDAVSTRVAPLSVAWTTMRKLWPTKVSTSISSPDTRFLQETLCSILPQAFFNEGMAVV